MSKYLAYPAYKDSGIEWLGDVPEHWEIKRLKFFAQISNGQDQKQVVDDNGDYPIYGSGGIFGRSNKCLYDQPSVLLGRKGTIDKPLFVTEPFWTVDTMYYTKIYPITFPKFFFYQCLTIQFAMYQYGSALPSMTQESLNGVMFSAPAFDEQRKIADFLDDKTAHLDKLIGQKQHMIGLLNEKRMALITQAVTKGLDLTVPMKASGVEWLGDVPEHWIVAGLTKFIESQVDYRGKTPEKVKSGTFLVTARNIKEGQINYDLSSEFVREEDYFEIMRRGIPEIGDVLFTTEAPLGEIANIDRTDIALAQRIIKIRGTSGVLNNYFLKYWMMSAKFQQHLWSLATGSTALGIKASKIFELRCVIPSFQEQADIVDYIDTETQKIDAMIKTVKQAITTLQEYRTALITAAVTGKIDVRDFKLYEG